MESIVKMQRRYAWNCSGLLKGHACTLPGICMQPPWCCSCSHRHRTTNDGTWAVHACLLEAVGSHLAGQPPCSCHMGTARPILVAVLRLLRIMPWVLLQHPGRT
jgi:hypothetical protein